MTSEFNLPQTTRRKTSIYLFQDTSGSMGQKVGNAIGIEQLNFAGRDMVPVFNNDIPKARPDIQFMVNVWEFNNRPTRITPSGGVEAESFVWRDLAASTGLTNFGSLLDEITPEFDFELMGRNSYKPVVILVTDGHATDSWEPAFERFLETPYGKVSTRSALGCADADMEMLKKFTAGSGGTVVWANEVADLKDALCKLVFASIAFSSGLVDGKRSVKEVYDDLADEEELHDGLVELCE